MERDVELDKVAFLAKLKDGELHSLSWVADNDRLKLAFFDLFGEELVTVRYRNVIYVKATKRGLSFYKSKTHGLA